MCFSANASFAASAVIGVIGITAVIKARTAPQRMLATIPLIFSAQQLSEGMIWLSLNQPGLMQWQSLFIDIFLIVAMAIWPLWIPLTMRLLEKDKQRKKILNAFIAVGATVSAIVVYLLMFIPLRLLSESHHLHYQFELPQSTKNLVWIFTILYVLATVVTPFISSIKEMKWLGIVFLAAYLITQIMFPGFVVSVWCYFAAVLSIIVLWVITRTIKMGKKMNRLIVTS
jgi:hypothetical protein